MRSGTFSRAIFFRLSDLWKEGLLPQLQSDYSIIEARLLDLPYAGYVCPCAYGDVRWWERRAGPSCIALRRPGTVVDHGS
jgi:hypothetical protein